MNNEQAARIAGVQSAARYFSNNPGSVEDIKLLASELTHFILTGETVMAQGHPALQQENHQVPAQQQQRREPDPHEETVMGFANRGHQATSRAEVEKVMREVNGSPYEGSHIGIQGQRVTLMEYLRECWKRLPREERPEVIDPTSHDEPVNPGRNETLKTELGL